MLGPEATATTTEHVGWRSGLRKSAPLHGTAEIHQDGHSTTAGGVGILHAAIAGEAHAQSDC